MTSAGNGVVSNGRRSPLARVRHAVEQLVDGRFDHRRESFEAHRCEHATNRITKSLVRGRIVEHHPSSQQVDHLAEPRRPRRGRAFEARDPLG